MLNAEPDGNNVPRRCRRANCRMSDKRLDAATVEAYLLREIITPMKNLTRLVSCALLCAFVAPVFGQPAAPDAAKKKEKGPPPPPLPEVVATEIPGVIKAGTKIVLLKAG